MPIYEFRCDKCGDFEELVFGKDVVVCPQCGGAVSRLMSACSFKSAAGDFKSAASTGSSCTGCSSSSCATCH